MDALERVAKPAASVRTIIGTVLFIVSVTATGTLALYGVFKAPTNVSALRTDYQALADSTANIRGVQLRVLGRLAVIEDNQAGLIRVLDSLSVKLNDLTASSTGLECVVLLELPARTCLSRLEQRRTP